MKYWAIFHKSGKTWLSAPNSQESATLDEATNKKPPRLFVSKPLANRFLTLWAKGPLARQTSTYSEWETGYTETVNKGWMPQTNPQRKRDDFEVKEVILYQARLKSAFKKKAKRRKFTPKCDRCRKSPKEVGRINKTDWGYFCKICLPQTPGGS